MATRRELKQAVGERYQAAGRWERRQLLDEFTRMTGCHRKHALRVLHHPLVPWAPRLRKRIYDEAVSQTLALLWEAADRICGKRLKALLPVLIESMECHGHLRRRRWGVGSAIKRSVQVQTFNDWGELDLTRFG
jgi:hypothetical protein